MFNKNLESINNAALKVRLRGVSPEESRSGISYCVTPSNDYVLLKNDLPSDDLNNPRAAINKIFAENIKNELKSNDIIIAFGLGLGYLLDEAFNKYPSRIFVYEPDLHLLHFVLNNVDLSEHLSSGRVFITNDLNELLAKLASSFITKDKVEIVYLPNYAVIKNQELLLMSQKVYETCKSKMVDVNTLTKFSRRWLSNTIENISLINSQEAFLLSDLENKFQGQTALIAGAGPSLDDNIAKIQANRNKFVIFAVNKVVKYLVLNGITPDYVVCLDAGNMNKTIKEYSSRLARANCIMDIRSDHSLLEMNFNRVFFNFSDSDFLAKKLANYNDCIKFYESGGSAATLALMSAVKMGFSKIVLAGLDLAFKGDTIYSSGEKINRVEPNAMLVDKVNKKLVKVKSVTGDYVLTREDYEVFIHHFETLIKELGYSEIYNLTTFGAALEGVKKASFEELDLSTLSSNKPAAEVKPFKLKVQEFVHDEFRCINNIILMLSKGIFSTVLVSEIIKSVLVYQYMQTDILKILQENFEQSKAEEFIATTKAAIKFTIDLLHKKGLS